MKLVYVSALALAFALAHAAMAADSKCVLREIGELPVAMKSGSPVIEATINGVTIPFVINTGSAATSLSRPAAQKLGLTVKTLDYVKMYAGRGGETVGEVGVKDLKVGPLEAKNLDLIVSGDTGVAGELGIQFLRQSDVEFDFPEGKVRFFKAEGCTGDQVVYWGKSYAVLPIQSNSTLGQIVVEVNVSGQPILAEMASGGGRSVVSPVAARFATVGSATPTSLGTAKTPGEVATFATFSFGDETIRNAKLGVADVFRKDREVRVGSNIAVEVVHRPDMYLGGDFFRAHRIYVSKSQNKVYVSYMGGPVFDTGSPKTETTASTAP